MEIVAFKGRGKMVRIIGFMVAKGESGFPEYQEFEVQTGNFLPRPVVNRLITIPVSGKDHLGYPLPGIINMAARIINGAAGKVVLNRTIRKTVGIATYLRVLRIFYESLGMPVAEIEKRLHVIEAELDLEFPLY
jgi:hypothetical protein